MTEGFCGHCYYILWRYHKDMIWEYLILEYFYYGIVGISDENSHEDLMDNFASKHGGKKRGNFMVGIFPHEVGDGFSQILMV